MKRALVLAGTGVVGLALAVIAGPLSPPGGPVASSYKTLSEVEPRTAIGPTTTPGDANSVFRITQPGSYYLTGNVTGVSGRSGIAIAVSDVTLDLNGFAVEGVPGSLSGILASVTSLSGIEILHGTVRGWGTIGVDLGGTTNRSRLSGVRVIGSGSNGITFGNSCEIQDCNSSGNGGNGILSLGNGGLVTGCIASNNTADGIGAGFGAAVTSCTATSNAGTGITGGSGCTVTNCAVFFSGTNGISVNNGSVVSGNSLLGTGLNGIVATFGVSVMNNACQQSGNAGSGAGILITGSDTRVEGNTCSTADRGIEVTGAGNLIVRNACANNTTDWVFAAGNVFGPIVDRRAPASGAVSGFAAGSSLGSTEPNANFSY